MPGNSANEVVAAEAANQSAMKSADAGATVDCRYRDRCALAGITAPILAGILPLTTATGMKRMAELAGGMRYPARLIRALNRAGDDPEAFRRIALHHATEQCADLLDHHADGIHLYTLNQAQPVLDIYSRLGLGRNSK